MLLIETQRPEKKWMYFNFLQISQQYLANGDGAETLASFDNVLTAPFCLLGQPR